MAAKKNHPMKRSSKPANGQLILALHPEAVPHPDPAWREELVKVLSDLLLEAAGMEPAGNQTGKEENDES
jgi:hypothetical protein